MVRLPYNKLPAKTSLLKPKTEVLALGHFCTLRSVRTTTTSGQYPTIMPSRSDNKRLVITDKENGLTESGKCYYEERSGVFASVNKMWKSMSCVFITP